MALTIGTQVGSYEITALLGKGGMGEVYRARDLKLKREVAIKILPEEFSRDPNRVSRFQREAEVLASLNHPNIAAIYDLEVDKGSRFLVLELVEGKTLAEKIRQGPLPNPESLRIIRQICDALDAAHERGIVHRDLKPANIKITPDGKVKLLDFGLARIFDDHAQVDLSNLPTLANDSAPGVIVGTAAYMSPEQAKGEVADRRSDIWGFGSVLYEMLTGRPVFEGKTVTELLGAVIYKDIDWTALPAGTPQNLQRLVRRCLEKDRSIRLRDIGDARLELEELEAGTDSITPVAGSGLPRWAGWAVAAVVTVAALAAFATRANRPGRPSSNVPVPELALTVLPAPGTTLSRISGYSPPEVSPDGTSVAYLASDGMNFRRLNSRESSRFTGDGSVFSNFSGAFWSSDSKSMVIASRRLVKVRVADGASETVATLPGTIRGGTWSDNGTILIAAYTAELQLYTLPAGRTDLKLVEMPGMKPGSYAYPEFLPASEDFLFYSFPERGTADAEGGVWLATLQNGRVANPSLLFKNDTAARYTPADGGWILFVKNDNLYAQRLNLNKRKLEGEPRLIETNVASTPGFQHRAEFSVSRSGIVATRLGKAQLAQVTTFDRQGNEIGKTGPPVSIGWLSMSPDETKFLVRTSEPWLLNTGQTGHLPLRNGDWNWYLWSPDGARLIGPDRPSAGGHIGERLVDGAGEVHELGENPGRLQDISPDGKTLLFMRADAGGIVSTRLLGSAAERAPRTFVPPGESAGTPQFSPDGHWVVYAVIQQGLFVQPFPGPGLRTQVSDAGTFPIWRKDGREILYLNAGTLWSVAVENAGDKLHLSKPQKLFSGLRVPADANSGSLLLAVSRDGSRIYFPQAVAQPDSNFIQIRMGW